MNTSKPTPRPYSKRRPQTDAQWRATQKRREARDFVRDRILRGAEASKTLGK